jgi:hypothetical protein
MIGSMSLRARRRLVLGACAAAAVVAAAASPERQRVHHLDHAAYLHTYHLVRAGTGLYEAAVAGVEHIGASVDQVRVLRQPWVYELWALLPPDALRWSFFVVVAFGSAALAAHVARHPEVGVAAGAWVAVAGVYGGVDAWLLFELWAVPFVLGTCLAWLRGRDGIAAACALGAMLLRETAVFLPLGFLVAAWRLGRPLRPWVVATGAAGAALAFHWHVASGYLDPDGGSARLLWTGGLDAVAYMTSFLVVPELVGLALWALGAVLLWRSALRPALALALLPLTGMVVNRPYWGFLVMPLCVTALGGLPPWRPARAPSRTPQSPPRQAATTAP